MAKRHGPTKVQLAKLPRLPRNEALVIEGGMRALTLAGRKRDETLSAQLTIWLNAGEQLVRSIAMIDADPTGDDATADVLGNLVTACTGPFPLPSPALQAPSADSAGDTPTLSDRLRSVLTPALPARIRVNDAALAAKAAEIFAPLEVPVDHVESLPAFDTAYASFARFLGADPEDAPQPFSWSVDVKLLAALFEAAAAFWRRAPWRYLPDHPPLLVQVGRYGPQSGVPTLYASVMGAAGILRGVAFYYSMEGLRQAMDRGRAVQAQDADVETMIEVLRQSGAPVDDVPREALRMMVGDMMTQAGTVAVDDERALPDSLALYYAPIKEVDPSYVDWLGKHSLIFRSRQGVPLFTRTAQGAEPRWPNAREVRAMSLALRILSAYFHVNEHLLRVPFLPGESYAYPVPLEVNGRREVFTVTFPPPDWTPDADDPFWAREDDSDDVFEPAPATEAGSKTLYRFLVSLQWKPEVWRRIEMRGDQTLDDLHLAIQDAFEWGNDHVYAFYLSGKPWDPMTEYMSPEADGRSAASFRLEHLPLHARQRIMYIFDFGDNLRHVVRLEAIVRDGASLDDASYPRIVERHGASVEQYPSFDPEV